MACFDSAAWLTRCLIEFLVNFATWCFVFALSLDELLVDDLFAFFAADSILALLRAVVNFLLLSDLENNCFSLLRDFDFEVERLPYVPLASSLLRFAADCFVLAILLLVPFRSTVFAAVLHLCM